MKHKLTVLPISFSFFAILAAFALRSDNGQKSLIQNIIYQNTVTPILTPPPLPKRVVLQNNYQVFQTFNNCGPAVLSMALSYYKIFVSQHELGESLRPYQNPSGNNDDKSVTLDELSRKANEFGLLSYHRPAGSVEKLKQFLAAGLPVITRTLLQQNEDIGHYRIIKGYDEEKNRLLQSDSLQGANIWYSYEDFNRLWQAFNYEYLVLVPKEKQTAAKAILGKDLKEKNAWENALRMAKQQQVKEPNNFYHRLNQVVALYHLERYQEATLVFEEIERLLPPRALWYQIEPILAYDKLGDQSRVLSMTEQILHANRAFSELYQLRGEIFLKRGEIEQARSEFEKALIYNINFKPAKTALARMRD
jgi:tetratricopeptide (TPR) repeat protein